MKRVKRLVTIVLLCAIVYLAPALFFPAPSVRHGMSCLPASLQGKLHDDWWRILEAIPRHYNVGCGMPPPVVLLGQPDIRSWKGEAKPVPLPGIVQIQGQYIPTGLWNVWLLNFTMTTNRNMHFRRGMFRWDDVDGYMTVPSAAFRYRMTFESERALWYWHNQ